ncbi:MAG: energy transducer TonB [Opitutaceae bacterium]|jgi:protein TonB|nr:energy transducer TonB [Opitutaceae bacterium]
MIISLQPTKSCARCSLIYSLLAKRKNIKVPYVLIIATTMLMVGCSSISDANLNEPPRVLYLAPAEYPLALKKAGITGRAIIEFVVTKSGDAVDARVVSATHPLFGQSAVESILKSKFTIPLKNGRPVYARMQAPLHFDLTPDE